MSDEREPLRVERAGGGAWRVTSTDGRSTLVHLVLAKDASWVHVDGDVFVFDADRESGMPRPSAGDDASLSAPMPATVIAIVAPAGTAVEEGDVLLLLEAMKMELPVRAPRAGTVTTVRCREGELVQPGVTLVDLT